MKLIVTLVVTLLYFPYCFANNLCDVEINLPSIRYLGVGALDIHYQNKRLLTDPFYSPQTLWDLISLTPYTPDTNQIKKVLGPAKNNVNAVLIGHGHYDHAADLPAITQYLNTNIEVFTSKSTQYMLQDMTPNVRILGLEGSQFEKWRYIADGWIRIQGIPSEHAPQAFGINLSPKVHNHAPEHPPKYIWEWSQGTNINWLIDFLKKPDSNEVLERIFVQTSASDFPVGLPNIKDEIAIDKAFLAAASFENVENYPTGAIKHLQPKSIYMIHWENFFKPWFEKPTPLSLIDIEKLMSEETLNNQLSKTLLAQPNTCY